MTRHERLVTEIKLLVATTKRKMPFEHKSYRLGLQEQAILTVGTRTIVSSEHRGLGFRLDLETGEGGLREHGVSQG